MVGRRRGAPPLKFKAVVVLMAVKELAVEEETRIYYVREIFETGRGLLAGIGESKF